MSAATGSSFLALDPIGALRTLRSEWRRQAKHLADHWWERTPAPGHRELFDACL
jgi:hypothetical protein